MDGIVAVQEIPGPGSKSKTNSMDMAFEGEANVKQWNDNFKLEIQLRFLLLINFCLKMQERRKAETVYNKENDVTITSKYLNTYLPDTHLFVLLSSW